MVRKLCCLILFGCISGLLFASDPSLTMTVVREKHPLDEDGLYWHPYTVWWVENSQGELIKILYITYFDDNTEAVIDLGCGKPGYLYTLSYYWNRFSTQGCPTDHELCTSCPSCPKDYTMVDGVTGCSERSSKTDTTIVSRQWDLTDREGNPVPDGIYTLCYDINFTDESQTNPQDKIYKVSIPVSRNPVDTIIVNPSEQGGFSHDSYLSLRSIHVQYSGDNARGYTDSNNGSVLWPSNSIPDNPTVDSPPESGFCGEGSVSAASLVLIALLVKRRRRTNG